MRPVILDLSFVTDHTLRIELVCPCAFPPETPLSEVHTAMARLERELRRAVPDVARVQIDPEPAARLEPRAQSPEPAVIQQT